MILTINTKDYTFTDNAVNLLMQYVATDASTALQKLNPTYKLVGEQIARKMLYDFEKKAVANGFDKEQAKFIRPEKNQSPIDKIISLLVTENAAKILEKVHLTILTSDTQITQVTYGHDE